VQGKLILSVVLSVAILAGASAQGPGGPGAGFPRGGMQGPGAPGAPAGAPAKMKPYADVITKDAKSDDGLFMTHQIDEKYYWEIPADKLGSEVLWVTTLDKSPTFYGFGQTEVQDRVVRFERRGDKILLRSVTYTVRADDPAGDMTRALMMAKVEPIIATFDIKTTGNKDSVVIDVTNVYTGDMAEFSAKSSIGASRMDPSRTFIDSVKSYPKNIEIKLTATFVAGGGGASPLGRRGSDGPSRDASTDAITVGLHHSIVALPEKPMMSRIADSRVGWFSSSHYEFGTSEAPVKTITVLDRWRLEKKDPRAALSEPVTPITYYLGSEIPAKWKPFVKRGVEEWNAAFEKIGYKNAIVCRDIPTKAEDPEFDQDDVRYTVIRWLPSGVENAYGPHISDPRTGEILNGSPKIFHSVLKLSNNWYFAQVSPNDPRAQKLPLPESLQGDLLAYVVTHEVGHTLGLPHNMRASSTFSIKQLRSKEWTEKWGDESSIMDYGRFNYVSQPGDGARLIPKLGPYDYFAIEYGYGSIPGAKTPADEVPALKAIANRQTQNPMLRFGNQSPEDPTRQSEDLGDDTVEATRLGLKNIDRVMGFLVKAAAKPGEDYEMLAEAYNTVMGQRGMELRHVLAVVGGMIENNQHAGQGTQVNYTPVPAGKQRAAVRLYNEQLFHTPAIMVRPDITRKFNASGIADAVLASQTGILSGLLQDSRLKRLSEQEALTPKNAYTVANLFDDLRTGIFSELVSTKPMIDLYRRNLQRTFVSTFGGKLTGTGDGKAMARQTLVTLRGQVKTASGRAVDRATRAHLHDLLKAIDDQLDPKVTAAAPAAPGAFPFPR